MPIHEYLSEIDDETISLQSYLQSKIEYQENDLQTDSLSTHISKIFLIRIRQPQAILKKPDSFITIDSCSTFKEFLTTLIQMFLTQKVQNVLTSGFYLDRVSNGVVEKAVSSIMDLLLLPSWKQLYLQVGNRIMFMLFTEYSIFYQLSPNHIIQLAGPYLSVVSREKGHYPPISLSVIYFHLSFSKYPGFVKNHIFSQLIQLNQAINRIETNSPSSAFAYKSIRKDVVMLLVHQVFKDCYSKWKNISFEEELKNLKIRYHLQVGVWNRKRIPFPPRLESCKQELAKLLYNCSRCCFSDSLEKTAPLPKEYVEYRNQWKLYKKQSTFSFSNQSQEFYCSTIQDSSQLSPPSFNLTECFVERKQILQFLHSCCKRVLPKGLLGSKRNWRAFFQNLQRFILSEYDGMSLEEFAVNIRLSEIHWLSVQRKPTAKDNQHAHHLFMSILSFLIHHFIFPLLSNHFYITNSLFAYDPPLFYRKPVFHSIVMNEIVSGYYASVFNRVSYQGLKTRRIASLRFVPKFSQRENEYVGVRPISNLRTIERSYRIRALFQVIQAMWRSEKYEEVNQMNLYSTENINEGFQIVNHCWKEDAAQYVLTMDIQKCYDSIQLPLLLDIINSKLTESFYRIIHYAVHSKSSHRTHFFSQLIPLSQDIFQALQSRATSSMTIFTGYIASYVYSRAELVQILKDTLMNYHIRLQHSFYKQVKGIPQGSILSIPLCNLYLRAFEKAQFRSFVNSSLQVIRFVDDFLLISTSRSLLQKLRELQDNENRYNIRLVPNHQRFFDVRKGCERKSDHVTTWCGFTIDSKRHLVYINFIKYQQFQKTKRFVKQDSRTFQSLYLSIKRVLQVRLNAISREQPMSSFDLQNRLILVYCSVLFALKRTLRRRRIMSIHKMNYLVIWMSQFVAEKSHLPMQKVKWIVSYCMLTTLRNAPVYAPFLKVLYSSMKKSEVCCELLWIAQHPSVLPLYNKKQM